MKENQGRKYSIKIKEIPERDKNYQDYLNWLPKDENGWKNDHIEAMQISTPKKLVEHAFHIFGFKIIDGHARPEIYSWLESLDWVDLAGWNRARPHHKKPASRNSKLLAIEDCVAEFYEGVESSDWGIYMFHPTDLANIAGLSAKHMEMTQFELGYELGNNKPAKSTATTAPMAAQKPQVKPKQTYASTAKKTIKKSATVVGRGAVKIGIQPQKLALHLRIQKGGDITKIVDRLKQSKLSKATEVTTIHASASKNYDCYQLKCTVDYAKLNFWLEEGFWPVGVVAKRWFGQDAVPFNQKKFTRKIFMSKVGDVTAATIIGHIRSVAYPDVKFQSVSFDKLGEENGSATVVIEGAGEIAKFKNLGLRASFFPVKVKWFRQQRTRTTAWHTA